MSYLIKLREIQNQKLEENIKEHINYEANFFIE